MVYLIRTRAGLHTPVGHPPAVVYFFLPPDELRATAARTRLFNADSSIASPARKSMEHESFDSLISSSYHGRL